MAYGDIHNKTGTICRAQSDETCPLTTDGGHSVDLDSYANAKGVDSNTLKGLVENARMSRQAAVELMGSGAMVDTPPAITKAPQDDPVARSEAAQKQLADILGPVPERNSAETPEQRYDRQITEYKIAMVGYENRMLANYAAAMETHKANRFAPRPDAPPFRTVYPKSFEAYDQIPKDFLPESLPAEIGSQPEGKGLWEEYLRKRKQLGDNHHSRGNHPAKVYYL